MILIYITLNTMDEGQRLAHLLIERRLTNCVNFHPITCTYVWEGKVTTEPEIVALVKTRAEHFDAVAAAVKEVVPYTNFVGQIEVPRVNEAFAAWLSDVVGVPAPEQLLAVRLGCPERTFFAAIDTVGKELGEHLAALLHAHCPAVGTATRVIDSAGARSGYSP